MPTVVSPSPAASWSRRGILACGATLLAYAATVATHRGEFWPFSIYPMFSHAGRPFTRALVLDVTDVRPRPGWGPWSERRLPGAPYPTERLGISTNDLAEIVKLTTPWTDERLAVVRHLLDPGLADGRTLLLTRADGSLNPDTKRVAVSFTALVRMSATAEVLHPYFRGRQG